MLLDVASRVPPGADGVRCPPRVAVTGVAVEGVVLGGRQQALDLRPGLGLAVNELVVVLAAVEDVAWCGLPTGPTVVGLTCVEGARHVQPVLLCPLLAVLWREEAWRNVRDRIPMRRYVGHAIRIPGNYGRRHLQRSSARARPSAGSNDRCGFSPRRVAGAAED